jgi:hypothetical protein
MINTVDPTWDEIKELRAVLKELVKSALNSHSLIDPRVFLFLPQETYKTNEYYQLLKQFLDTNIEEVLKELEELIRFPGNVSNTVIELDTLLFNLAQLLPETIAPEHFAPVFVEVYKSEVGRFPHYIFMGVGHYKVDPYWLSRVINHLEGFKPYVKMLKTLKNSTNRLITITNRKLSKVNKIQRLDTRIHGNMSKQDVKGFFDKIHQILKYYYSSESIEDGDEIVL